MRKKDKEIKERSVIESVIRKSLVCRIAMSDGNNPYIVPMCFGYRDNVLFFHTGKIGKKIEILSLNNRICFEFDLDHYDHLEKLP